MTKAYIQSVVHQPQHACKFDIVLLASRFTTMVTRKPTYLPHQQSSTSLFTMTVHQQQVTGSAQQLAVRALPASDNLLPTSMLFLLCPPALSTEPQQPSRLSTSNVHPVAFALLCRHAATKPEARCKIRKTKCLSTWLA